MTDEPGLDRHEWESEYSSFADDLEDDPYSGLPQLADLVERMLGERGYDFGDPVARNGSEPAIVKDYFSARETSDRVEQGDDVDPGDVGAAIVNLRELFEILVVERRAP